MQFINPQQLKDFIKPNSPIKIYNHNIRIYVTPTHTEQNDDNDFSIYGNNVIIVNYRQSKDLVSFSAFIGRNLFH